MTYKELLAHLLNASEEQLDQNVTVYLSETDEWVGAESLNETKETDVLDSEHLFLIVPF